MPGLLQRLFGGSKPAPRDFRQAPTIAGLDPIAEHAVALQRSYWSADGRELAELETRPFAELSSAELLRLHHLRCLALVDGPDDASGVLRRAVFAPVAQRPSAAEQAAALDACASLRARIEQSARALLARRSPTRPRHGFAWLGPAPPAGDAVPYSDFQGRLINASLTHLGSVEVLALDERYEPAAVEFVDFDQILTLALPAGELDPAAPFRPAKLLHEYGQPDRLVLLPLRYGLTWRCHEPALLRGAAEHQVAAIELSGLADPSKAVGNPLDRRALGIGVGPQRLECLSDYPETEATEAGEREGGLARFGLAQAYQISLAIDQDDPRFADKCRGRGLDPEATRGDVVRESRLRASAKAARRKS